MKRLTVFLIVCLMLMACVPAAAVEPFHYESKTLGFSMSISGLSNKEITVEESDTGVNFFHAPSREKWGGLIGSIEVVAPRSKFFQGTMIVRPIRLLRWEKIGFSVEVPRRWGKYWRRNARCFYKGIIGPLR